MRTAIEGVFVPINADFVLIEVTVYVVDTVLIGKFCYGVMSPAGLVVLHGRRTVEDQLYAVCLAQVVDPLECAHLVSLESEFMFKIDLGAEFLCPGEAFLLSLIFLVPITFSIIRLYDSFIDLKSFVEFVVLDPIHPVSPEAVIAEYRKVIVAELSQFLSVWLHIIPLLRLILVLRIELSYVHLFAEVVGLPEEYLDLLAPQRCFDGVVGFRPGLHVTAHVVAGDAVIPVEFQRREADVAEAGSYVEYVDLARLFDFDPGKSGVAV